LRERLSPSPAAEKRSSPIEERREAHVLEGLEHHTAASVGRLLAAGTLDPVETTEFFLDRVAQERENAAFILVTGERARREAVASRRRYREGRPTGPLDGVPVAWKDLMDMAGTRTTAGSALFADAPPKQADAPIVSNLTAAGMVALGKTNLSEFAFSGIGLNPHFGNPINPRDPKTPRISGGSSSGSAVAVAAGLAPCAIGSDTGGSIRAPAAFCGIVGFKPTEGRIDKRDVFPLSRTLDTIGPLARSVEDCVLIDMALRGQLTTTVHRADLKQLELVVPSRAEIDDIEDSVGANLESALSRLSAAGAKIERRAVPLIGEMRALGARHGSLVAIEAYAEHRSIFESADAERMDRRVVRRALLGRAAGHDVIALQRGRESLIAALASELGDALLVLPTTPMIAPEISVLEADDEVFRAANLRAVYYTVLGNLFRMCGLSLPSGADGAGMPTGVQFLAPAGRDERLLSFGLAIERALANA
jgi:aspartyl-tRNA(Asn)/glutamyl-tRNA(Gln) amidotransferase subunit A